MGDARIKILVMPAVMAVMPVMATEVMTVMESLVVSVPVGRVVITLIQINPVSVTACKNQNRHRHQRKFQ